MLGSLSPFDRPLESALRIHIAHDEDDVLGLGRSAGPMATDGVHYRPSTGIDVEPSDARAQSGKRD